MGHSITVNLIPSKQSSLQGMTPPSVKGISLISVSLLLKLTLTDNNDVVLNMEKKQ